MTCEMLHMYVILIWPPIDHTHPGPIRPLLKHKNKAHAVHDVRCQTTVDVTKQTCPCVSPTEQECRWLLPSLCVDSFAYASILVLIEMSSVRQVMWLNIRVQVVWLVWPFQPLVLY